MRIYNIWGGNPKGTKEDPTRCVVDVPAGGRSPLYYQCSRKRGKGEAPYAGLLCGVHAYHQRMKRHLYVPKDE